MKKKSIKKRSRFKPKVEFWFSEIKKPKQLKEIRERIKGAKEDKKTFRVLQTSDTVSVLIGNSAQLKKIPVKPIPRKVVYEYSRGRLMKVYKIRALALRFQTKNGKLKMSIKRMK